MEIHARITACGRVSCFDQRKKSEIAWREFIVALDYPSGKAIHPMQQPAEINIVPVEEKLLEFSDRFPMNLGVAPAAQDHQLCEGGLIPIRGVFDVVALQSFSPATLLTFAPNGCLFLSR